MKVLHRAVCALVVLASLLALPAAASADTGSYTATWTGNNIYNQRIWTNGSVITPPATVPANATITSISGWFNWNQSAPWNSRYEGRICDFADGEHNISPTFATGKGCMAFGNTTGNYWALNGVTGYAGKNAATTKIYFGARLNDYSTSNIHAAVSPYRYMNNRSITVNYEYTPAP